MTDYLENLFSLKGKTAIVTGGSRGIGAEIALAYANCGANVVCIARSELADDERLQSLYRQCDISDERQFQELCESVKSNYGGIDILVNAAGISLSEVDSKDELERFTKTLEVNLIATYQCCNTASKFMKNGGSIINITSIGAMQGFPNNPSYVASKGGVKMLTKALAVDLGAKGIRVNNIAPGYIKTDMTAKSFANPVANKERVDRMIIPRWGETIDLVGAAIFLASKASSYTTGSSLVIDGGWTAKGM